jgi:peroxiredoxin
MKEIMPSATQEIGMSVAEFHLSAVSGGIVSLQKLLENKRGAVVAFWSSVCSHCVRYDRYLNGFAQQHPDLGLVAIVSREEETPDQLLATAAARKLTFPIVHDRRCAVATQWFVRQTPRVFLIDSNGVLRYRGAIDNYKYPGDIEYSAYLEPVITQFLLGNPLGRTETASFGCAIQSVYYSLPKAL